jgi:hypothetical protein
MRPIVRAVDHGLWGPVWTIHKFREHRDRVYKAGHIQGLPLKYLLENFELLGALRIPKNLLLNEGINLLWTLACGGAGTPWNNANAYIGVGDSTTTAVATQTGLQASTNKYYNPVDSGYPTYGSSQYATWRSTFGSSLANFAWNEITACNSGSDAGANLDRLVQSMGTKASGTSWVATLQVSLS